MLNRLRPQVKVIIDPVAKRIPINPNVLTIIGLIISVLSAYMFSQKYLMIGGLLIVLSGIVDMLDGAVARNHSTKTPFGGILDSTSDRFADAFILIGIIYGGYVGWFTGVLAIVACLSVSYVRARVEAEGIKGNIGIAERAERLVILIAGVILSIILNLDIFMYYAVVLIVILGYLTVLQRVYHAWKQLKDNN